MGTLLPLQARLPLHTASHQAWWQPASSSLEARYFSPNPSLFRLAHTCERTKCKSQRIDTRGGGDRVWVCEEYLLKSFWKRLGFHQVHSLPSLQWMNNQVTHGELLVGRLQHVLTSCVLDLREKDNIGRVFRYNMSGLPNFYVFLHPTPGKGSMFFKRPWGRKVWPKEVARFPPRWRAR